MMTVFVTLEMPFRNLNYLKPITYIITWMLGKIFVDTSEEVLSGFDSFSEIVPSYFLSPTDYFILDLVWVSFGYMEGDIVNGECVPKCHGNTQRFSFLDSLISTV